MSPTPECDVLARASLPIPSSDAFWAVNPSPPQLPCNCKRARARPSQKGPYHTGVVRLVTPTPPR